MLKDIASIVQICFYVVGATIAILTYRSAKRGLLNTVNTEYHKRVIDHLHELSELLYAEIDNTETGNHRHSQYFKDNDFLPTAKEMTEQFIAHVKNGANSKDFRYRRPTLPLAYKKYHRLKTQVESDPFIPDVIRDYVVNYLNLRAIANKSAIDNETQRFYYWLKEQNGDALKNLPCSLDEYMLTRGNPNIQTELHDKGFSRKYVEAEAHKIRIMIKDYLKSFNPLPWYFYTFNPFKRAV